MPRWFGLRFAIGLLLLLAVTVVAWRFATKPELPWYRTLRGLGIPLVLSLGLSDRRRWAWWAGLAWFALAAAVSAAFIPSALSLDVSPWILVLLSALHVVGFGALLSGRSEIDAAAAASSEDAGSA